MADCFLDGELPLDSFIDDYQSKRKLAHLRRVKIDKLREVVLKGPPTLAQSSATHTPTQPLPQEPTSPSPFLGYTNGSPILLPSRHQPTPPPAQSGPLPYPLAPYPMPGPSYPSPMFQQYPPALPQRPTPGLPPRTGFMMQWCGGCVCPRLTLYFRNTYRSIRQEALWLNILCTILGEVGGWWCFNGVITTKMFSFHLASHLSCQWWRRRFHWIRLDLIFSLHIMEEKGCTL